MNQIIGYFWSQSEVAQCVTCGLRTIQNRPRPTPEDRRGEAPRPKPTDDETAADTPNAMHHNEIIQSDGIRCDTCGARIGWAHIHPTTFEDLWMRRRLRQARAHVQSRC